MTPALPLDRFGVCEAYSHYDTLWGPTPYGVRLHRIGYRPGILQCLEKADDDVKWRYGRLVREHNRLYVGYERLRRKANGRAAWLIESWPGTQNMKGCARDWLQKRGLLRAVEACMGEG
jgi:hypothetical protein